MGSAVVDALGGAGHGVWGLARSDDSAEELKRRGYAACPGDLKQPGSLSRAITRSRARAVVHAATTGDSEAESADRRAVEETLAALRGTRGVFVYTSGGWVMGNAPGSAEEPPADEDSPLEPAPSLRWRPAVEHRVLEAAAEHGVRALVVRPALVYGRGGGVVAELVDSARERGAARYVVGEEPGSDPLWTLVHTSDLGDLYVRMLAAAGADGSGGEVVIAAGTRPVPVREIAAEASRLCGSVGSGGEAEPCPLSQARRELGEYADSLVLSQRLSGEKARGRFGWQPSGPSVFEELARGSYAPDGSGADETGGRA